MELANYQSYAQYKQELDGELRKSAEGFVRIGWLLKVARDTNILAESGYKSVTEFAQKEYGLDKTQVSRFISINDRFARGGEHLLPEYEEYGYAKLTIMLQIPEEITQELTPEYTKAEIQAIKEELDEEKKVSDLEVFLEAPQQEEETDVMWMTLKQLGHDEPDLWEKMWKLYVSEPFLGADETAEIMAPSGDKNYSVRIMGKGRVMLTMKDGEDAVTITNTRTLEKNVYTKQQMANWWGLLLHADAETAAEAWQKMYLEPWPKAEVAPVQQPKKEEKANPAKKESRVTKAKTPEKPKKPSTEPTPAAVVEEPKIEGQMSVKDYPELMPDGEENDGKDAGIDAGDVQSGMPDRAGDEAPVGRSEDMEGIAGGEVSGADEGDGAPEGGGREEDHERLVEEAWYRWMDLRQAMPPTRMVITAKVKELYHLTIKLAAALEALINES